jgi:hypothetical protein
MLKRKEEVWKPAAAGTAANLEHRDKKRTGLKKQKKSSHTPY